MMRLIACLLMINWPSVLFGAPVEISNLAGCKKISWLTPSTNSGGGHIMIEIDDANTRSKLIEIFSKSKEVDGIDHFFLDENSTVNGYLIFHLESSFWVLKINPHPNKKKSALVYKMLSIENQLVTMSGPDFGLGIEVESDYRDLIKLIRRPTNPSPKQVFKVLLK